MGEKAMVLSKTYKISCEICLLLDTEAAGKDVKWHLYREGYTADSDKYVCDTCLRGLQDIRKKCHQKMDNPHHKVFKDFLPWFSNEIPGLKEKFEKIDL